jgi:MoxR-like ATPase
VLRGRRYVVPQDVYDVAPEVLRHRITLTYDALAEGVHPEGVVERLLRSVPAPNIAPDQAVHADAVTLPMAAAG